jgi:hypothetical protein
MTSLHFTIVALAAVACTDEYCIEHHLCFAYVGKKSRIFHSTSTSIYDVRVWIRHLGT